ncbi:hypothetical protein DL765_007627 [Monosporascus sp. GIB2]|nr:hypothetical protein DL765_007627 [Monosporascus sp. GIB2]
MTLPRSRPRPQPPRLRPRPPKAAPPRLPRARPASALRMAYAAPSLASAACAPRLRAVRTAYATTPRWEVAAGVAPPGISAYRCTSAVARAAVEVDRFRAAVRMLLEEQEEE